MIRKRQRGLTMIIIAIIATSFLGDCINGFNPVLDNISDAFPDLSYTMVSLVATIPNITYCIAALAIGAIVGKQMKYRTALILGCLFILIGGVAPAVLYKSFAVLMLSRLVFGLGLGTLVVINGYASEIFEGKERQKILGWHVTSMNAGSVVLLLIAGVLGDIHWHVAAYSYLLAIIPLISAFFIKEPSEIKGIQTATETAVKKEKTRVGPNVIVYCIIIIIFSMALYSLLLIMSPYVVDNNLGSSTEAGILLSVYTAGGAFGGLIFDKMRSLYKQHFLTCCCLMVMMGAAMFYWCGVFILIAVGAFTAGWGFYSVMTVCTELAAKQSNDASVALATSIIWIGTYLGCFIGSFWMTGSEAIFGELYFGVIMSILIVFGLFAIIFLIKNPLKHEYKQGEIK